MADINKFIDPKLIASLERINSTLATTGTTIDSVLLPAIKRLEEAQKGLGKETNKNDSDRKKLTTSEKEAAKIAKQLEATETKLISLQKGQQDALIKTRTELQKNTKATKDLQRAQVAQKGSTEQLTAVNIILEKRLRSVNQTTDKGRLSAQRLTSAIDKNNAKITAQSSALTKVKRGIGTYTAGIKKAAASLAGALGLTSAMFIFINGIKSGSKAIFNLTKQIQGETIRSITVFGDQLGYVESQAEKVAAKMGVTNREFVSMAANTADLLIPLEFTREAAAKMSTQVQSLAGALDEWTAGKYGVVEVSNILTKATLGEMEQLKNLGIAIRQDSKEFINLVKLKKEDANVTDGQARAMATLELIYKKSTDAQAAYLLEGNKLLRFQKSINLSFKNFKENIATGFAESMKTATQLYIDQQKEVQGLEKNLIPLIGEYETLQGKTALSAVEHERIKTLISQIADIAPTAITQWDNYGNAIAISADKAHEFVEIQKAMLEIQNADAIAEQEKALEKLNVGMDILQTKLRRGELTEFGEWQKLSAKETAKLNTEIKNLGREMVGTEAIIKKLKGEQIFDIDESKDSIVAVVSLIDAQNKLIEQAKKLPETTEAEITAKNKKIAVINTEISRLKSLGIEKGKVEAFDFDSLLEYAEPEAEDPLDISWLTDRLDAELAAKKRSEEEWTAFAAEQQKIRTDANNEQDAQDAENDAREKSNREATKEAAINAAGELGNTLFNLKTASLQREFEAAEGNAAKQAEISKKLAQHEKKQALFGIAVATAKGVMTALASLPPNVPLSLIIGGMGLVQAGVVAATPIPEFAKGTNYSPSGAALVGEKGRELIVSPKGNISLASNPSLVNLERGSRVIPNRQTENILNDRNIVGELKLTRKAIQRTQRQKSKSVFDERNRGYRDGFMAYKHRLN